MKSYTDIEQSKKLAKILPIESADMAYIKIPNSSKQGYVFSDKPYFAHLVTHSGKLSCWSLAALLDVIPIDRFGINYHEGTFYAWADYYGEDEVAREIETETDTNNPIDACYELIVKLNEKELI